MRKKQKFLRVAIATGYTERYKTFHVDSPRLDLHFVSLHHRSISNSLGAMAENVIFRRFWAKIRPFSPGNHSNELTNQLLAGNIFVWRRGLHDQCI